jgi:hypothetical protein
VFLYLNKQGGTRVQIGVDSYDDLMDEERRFEALEKLYLRALYYNDMCGVTPEPPKRRLTVTRLYRGIKFWTR